MYASRYLTALALLALPACSPEGDPSLADGGSARAELAGFAEPSPAADTRATAPAATEPGRTREAVVDPPPAAESGPVLRAAAPTFEFGTVSEGALVRHTFELQSTGTADLVVSKIKPGCGCTAADPIAVAEDGSRSPYEVGTPLSPGARLEVDVTFDTFGKPGPHAKAISIYCNDPRGVERLALKGNVEPLLNVVPNSLTLGKITIGQSRTGEVALTTRGGERVLLSSDPKRRPASLGVVLTPRNPDAQGRASAWVASVTLGGDDLREGPFQFQVSVVSDVANPSAPVGAPQERAWLGTTVLVTAEVMGLYAVSPREMFFGPVAADTAASRTVRIVSYADEPPVEQPKVRLIGLEGEPLANAERYHLTVAALDDAAGWTVELLLDGLPAGHGLFGGKLVVETENPDQPEVAVPFKGVVR